MSWLYTQFQDGSGCAAHAEAIALSNPRSLGDAHSRVPCDHLHMRTQHSQLVSHAFRGPPLRAWTDRHLNWPCGKGPCRCRRCWGAWGRARGLLHAGPLRRALLWHALLPCTASGTSTSAWPHSLTSAISTRMGKSAQSRENAKWLKVAALAEAECL